jgi:hypothetical protein
MDIEDLLPQQPAEGEKGKKESPLVSLEKDLELYSDSIKEVAIDIMMEGISTHPIFIAHQHIVNIGELILNRDDLNTNWTIQREKKPLFLKTYKKPEDYMCVFVIVPEGANFIYYPYKKRNA